VLLYEMLTGKRPFDGDTLYEIVSSTLHTTPKQPRDVVPTCPLMLDELCMRMLDKAPERRPASVAAIASEVEAFLDGIEERRRRREEAAKICLAAEVPVRREHELGIEREQLLDEARKRLRDVQTCDPVEVKRAAWELEDHAAAVERMQALSLAEAV